MRDIISTNNAPQAIGPYSQAIRAGGFVFTSGQIPIDPATQQLIAGDVALHASEEDIAHLASLVGAMLFGADRRSAAEFSFWLAMPTMVGAFAYEAYKSSADLAHGEFARAS